MDIRSTISNELAEDVKNLLQKYLNESDPKISRKVANTISGVLSGDENKITENAKYNIAKTGFYASAALAASVASVTTGSLILDGLDPNVMTYESQTLGLSAALGISAIAGVLHRQLKDLKIAVQREQLATNESAQIEQARSERVIPKEVKALIEKIDKNNIDTPEMLIKALEATPRNDIEHLKQLAWIHSMREQIKDGKAPLEHQYDSTPPSQPKMKM